MRAKLWFHFAVILWLLQLSNAKPRNLLRNNKNVHFTNIGDISTKDLLRIADESTPADKRFTSPEPYGDSADNDIENETNQYYLANNTPDLASPREQEENFVNLLKKQYRGTFPEYGKETEADYMKNKELEDNLNAQPETVFLGHSDMYHGMNGKSEDAGDLQVPDDVPPVDNLDTFDGDSNLLNGGNQDTQEVDALHGNSKGATEGPHHTIVRYHTHKTTGDNDEVQNDYSENTQTDISGLSEDEDAFKGTTDIDDGRLETHMEQEESSGLDEDTEKQKMKEKTAEEKLWDAIEKYRQKELLNKKKKNKPGKTKNSEKKKAKDNTTKILTEFEELKEHKGLVNDGHNGLTGNGEIVENVGGKEKSKEGNSESESSSFRTGTKGGKKIKYIHTEESQVAGDAILDFLDKLLDKDPQKLRHDVLSLAKEMQNEGNSNPENSIISEEKQQNTSPNPSTTTKKPHRKLKIRFHENKDIDKWISQLEDEAGKEKQAEVDDQSGIEDSYENKEYNEFHDQDIYPDHNGGETVSNGPRNDKNEENENKGGKDKMKDSGPREDQFDNEEFKEEALKVHNEFRRRHNAVALEWSEKLANQAHEIAVKLIDATRNSFKRELQKQGESIAILPYLTKNIAKTAVEKWYSEITRFSFTNPEVKPETRDFTQIIWKGSKQVGMGFAYTTDKKKTLVIGLYSPAGNDERVITQNLNTVNNDPYSDIRRADIESHN